MSEQIANNAATTLAAAVTTAPAAGTSETWTVASTAAPLPQSGVFRLIVDTEYVLVTSVLNATQLQVTRGAEGSTPATHANGAQVTHVITAGTVSTLPGVLMTTKGDLLVGGVGGAPGRIGIGVDDNVLVADSTATAGVRWGKPASSGRSPYMKPTAARYENVDRGSSNINNQATIIQSGVLTLCAILLPQGLPVSSISFVSGTTAAVTPTNQWFGLWDSNWNKLRLTTDDTTTAWAANSLKTLNLTSVFTTTYTGLHYVSFAIVATTVPSLMGVSGTSVINGLAPMTTARADTVTNPASAPATAAPTAATNSIPYCYIS